MNFRDRWNIRPYKVTKSLIKIAVFEKAYERLYTCDDDCDC